MVNKNSNKDVMVVGFALFAMFFGAGNLIFPPFLGVISGSSWLTGFGGFILAIPRTAATTFEMGIQPLAGGFSPILFSIIFFVYIIFT